MQQDDGVDCSTPTEMMLLNVYMAPYYMALRILGKVSLPL